MPELLPSETTEQNQALGKALDLFWARGAEVASYADLVKATGLSRKALYAHWPDKGALIADTLKVYYDQLVEFVEGLLQPGGVAGLTRFWDGFESIAQRETWHGCYLFRTSVGPLRGNCNVQELYQKYGDFFIRKIASEISAAQQAGDIDSSIDAKNAGLICFSLMGNISTIGGQSGYDNRVGKLFELARVSCGLKNLVAS